MGKFLQKFLLYINQRWLGKRKYKSLEWIQKASLVRRHRQVIYFNDSEMAAIRAYCDKFRVNTKAALFREAIIEKVLSELDDNHPTLF